MTVFCDFDGPIIDVGDRYYSTYKLALTETVAYYHEQNIFIPCRLQNQKTFWEMKKARVPDVEIAQLSGLEGEQIQFFRNRVVEIVNQPEQLHQDKMQAGVGWALTYLRVNGIKLVLVTLREQEQATRILQQLDLFHLFAAIYGTQQESAAYQNQPQQKTQLLAQAIAEQLPFGCDCDRTWMVGDTEADLIAAQAAGVKSIALTCGIRNQQVLEQFSPTEIFSDLLSFTLSLVHQTELVAA
ncbi:HAD family hydrolase [Merismopedia glauca]|nr:HAD hydrolase-like protein [Merismopedia glauca]